MKAKKVLILLLHAFIGWVLCGATIGIGRAVTTMEATLIIHLVAAPVFFSILSLNYFSKFSYTKPFATAILFIGFVILMDAGLVAPVFEKSYEMFRSPMGTWIPFILIFLSTYLTGLLMERKEKNHE